MEKEYDLATAIYDITYKCNDKCTFCFNQKQINVDKEMSLKDIKHNFNYVKKKYSVTSVILTGGEPTLHSDFWGVMKFFYKEAGADISPSLNTNGLIFTDDEKAARLKKLLASSCNKKVLSISISTIENTLKLSDYEINKFKGVKNTILAGLESDTKVIVVITITKKNYKAISSVAERIIEILDGFNKKHGLNAKIVIQLRLPYIGQYYLTEKQHKENVPEKFSDVQHNIVSAIKKILSNQLLVLRLFNIPLCLLKEDINIDRLRKQYNYMGEELRMKVSHERQFEKIRPNLFHRDAVKLKYCSDCILKFECNKIQNLYIEKGIVKSLKPNLSDELKELKQMILDEAIVFNKGLTLHRRNANWLVDCRKVMLKSRGSELISKLLFEKFKTNKSRYVCGSVIAGNPLVTYLVQMGIRHNRDIRGLLARKTPKKNGLCRTIEGDFKKGERVVIIDDLTNSGNTLRRAMDEIEKLGGIIEGVLVLINFKNEAHDYFKKSGISLQYLYTLEDLFLDNKSEVNKIVAPKKYWSLHGFNLWQISAPRSSPILYKKSIMAGTNEGKLLSIDSKTGKINWTFEKEKSPLEIANNKGIHSTPAVYNDNVFFGAYDGYLYCLDADSGKLVWKKKRGDWIGSSPCIVDDVVYIGIEYGHYWGVLIACSAKDGRLLWSLKTNHYIHSSPSIDIKRKIVVVGCNDGFVYAAHSITGKLLWKYYTGRETRGGFAIDEETGLVYFGSETGSAYCLDINNGNLIWKKKISKRIFNTPEIVGDNLVLSVVSKRIFCLNKTNGSIRWFYNTEDLNFSYTNTIDGKVYCGSDDNHLYIIDMTTGQLIGKYYVGNPILSKPLICGDNAILACKGMICSIDLDEFETIEESESAPPEKSMILFDITYRCNDNCKFCHNRHLQDKGKNDSNLGEMKLGEIKENAKYLIEKFKLSGIAVSGGEPTIHPNFWEVMDFFYNDIGRTGIHIALDTNTMLFSDNKEAIKLQKFLSRSSCKKKGIEISLCTVNHPEPKTFYERKKMKGVINTIRAALSSDAKIKFYMYITRMNYKALPEILNTIFKEIDRYDKPNISIETGMISFDIDHKETIESVPKNYESIRPYVESMFDKILKKPDINLHLMNLPLCLLKDYPMFDQLLDRIQFLPDSQELMRINVWNQKSNIIRAKGWTRRSNWQTSFRLIKYCSKCRLRDRCNKLKERFLEEGIIDELYPFK
ncbi:PQQ-binding-like beta-propeller repeat protein [Candidatus Woesearchaeota archaeon]|nr:PQQ-binding-like beta-propeller repeat protein [Candidatus Woesearchaeota archaeon]